MNKEVQYVAFTFSDDVITLASGTDHGNKPIN